MSYENPKLICTFYTKIGACRHGEKCSRRHIKPTSSDTILMPNLYKNPRFSSNEGNGQQAPITDEKELQQHFEDFYKDVFVRAATLGKVDAMVVCENNNNHLNGNVYIKFASRDIAYDAVVKLNQEWYDGRPVYCELSPVESLSDANCRAYDTNSCSRGDHCNFMHIRRPSPGLKNFLFRAQEKSFLTQRIASIRQNSSAQQTPESSAPPASMINTTSPEAVQMLFNSSR